MSAFLGLGRWWMSMERPTIVVSPVTFVFFQWPRTVRLMPGLRARDGLASVLCCSVKLFFLSPRTALSVGVEVGGTWSSGLHCIAWLQLGMSSFSLSLCVIATGATNFTYPFHPTSLRVAQCLSIIFSLEPWQCSQAIAEEMLFIPSYRDNTRGILKRNKVRERKYFPLYLIPSTVSYTYMSFTVNIL